MENMFDANSMQGMLKSLQNRKLEGIEPGLVKLVYSVNTNTYEELALKNPGLGQPNGILAYRPWLRDRMKMADLNMRTHGFESEMHGFEVLDEHVERQDGRHIFLNESYLGDKNLTLLAPFRSPVLSHLVQVLLLEGFDAKTSK
ncbi:hypothetical protein KY314_04425 [Candidatus Woesearchaeota archaeon]|nr:hypothetical protein [Candidatus Woesearchaeota archaeon]